MKTKVHINPAFSEIKDFMKMLPTTFKGNGKTLKNDRNEIKVIQHKGFKLCIKSFNRVTVFNRYMYSWFRASKAKRSYEVGRRLEKKHINTPTPVGYVEVYDKWHILRKAFYVSIYQEHDYDMADVLDKNIEKQEAILTSFADHMARIVHPAGAWHNDLSTGNVLINSNENEGWSFSFIDLNRMEFRRDISSIRGLTNLKKMTNNPVALSLMAEQYAISAKRNTQLFSIVLLRRNFSFVVQRFFTKKVLSIFKPRKKNIEASEK